MVMAWSPGSCCCGGCHITTHTFRSDGDDGLIGWTLHSGSVSVNEDGSIELAANTRIVLDSLPAKVEHGDHAVVSFPAIAGTLRIGQPIGDGDRGEFFDITSSKVEFRRIIYSTDVDNPGGLTLSEYPVDVHLRSEAIDASGGGALAIAMRSRAARAKFAPAGESTREDGGQSVFANNYRLLPNANVLTDTDPRLKPSGDTTIWPGANFVNAATSDFVPPSTPSDAVSQTLQIETFGDAQTITGLQFEKSSCFTYGYWGGGFRESALPWNIVPTVEFDTDGINAYLSNTWQNPKFATMIQDDFGETYFEDNYRSPAFSSVPLREHLAIYNQQTGSVLTYGDSAAVESDAIGLDPSGTYDLFNLYRDSTTEVGYRGNGAVIVSSTPGVAMGNGLWTSIDIELLIWFMAAIDQTMIRVTIPVGPGYRWTFQSVIDGLLSETAGSYDLDPILALPNIYNASGAAGHSGALKRSATQVVDGQFVGIELPVGFSRGGTCTISW